MTNYNKFWVAALGVLANALYAYQTTNPSAWVTAALSVLTALGVYQVRNTAK